MSVAAIIVAAGASCRLGQPKQLVLMDGEPLLQRAIRSAIEAGAKPVFVVLGAHREAIQKTIDLRSATVLVNDNWDEGLASSIRIGVKAVDSVASGITGVLLMTCDQPRVIARHLSILIEKSEEQPTAMIASVYARTRGTPAVFPRVMCADLLVLRGDKGARGLLEKAPRPVVEVLLDGGEVDIDRPEDLGEPM